MKSDFLLKTYVINLDRSKDRLIKMEDRIGNRLIWERISAIEGKLLSLNDSKDIDVEGYQKQHGKSINMGEVGCYLSHIKCLQRLLGGNGTHALILEDDVEFKADFFDVLVVLIENSDDWDIVKLSGFHNGNPIGLRTLTTSYSLGIPRSRHNNTAALLVNRATAQSILDALLPMRLPYDHALERPWTYSKRLRIVSPSPCHCSDGSASTIDAARSYKFPWYRRLPTFLFRLKNELSRLAWAYRERKTLRRQT